MDKKSPKEIQIPAWIGHGTGRLIRREALPPEHPESDYNYVLKTYGVDPTEYGIKAPGPHCDKCGNKILNQEDL